MVKRKKIAVLFDMDGVITNSIPSHIEAWIQFGKNHGLKVTRKLVLSYFNGRTNQEILEYLFKRKLSKIELEELIREKENIYHNIFKKHAKPLFGLIKFLKELTKEKIKFALATAGPPQNVEFVLSAIGAKKYFKHIVNASHVTFGKPHPEIYLKAAKKIRISPKYCIAFEDAFNGVESAKRAGMKVVGVSTTHSKKELSHTDLVIKDFKDLTIKKLEAIF